LKMKIQGTGKTALNIQMAGKLNRLPNQIPTIQEQPMPINSTVLVPITQK